MPWSGPAKKNFLEQFMTVGLFGKNLQFITKWKETVTHSREEQSTWVEKKIRAVKLLQDNGFVNASEMDEDEAFNIISTIVEDSEKELDYKVQIEEL